MSLLVCLNGRILPEDEARIPIGDRGFLYGDTVYETLRSHRRRPVFWAEHYARLERSCELVQMDFDLRDFRLESRVREVLEVNALDDARLRITLSRGVGGPDVIEGFEPNWLVTATPLLPLSEETYRRGISAILTNVMRQGDPEAKTGNYLPSLLARRQARKHGAHEGILRNHRGQVTEGASTNLFWIRGGVLETPSIRSGILHGVTRAKVMELAGNLPSLREAREVEAGPDALDGADEIFLTSTTWEVISVTTWEGRTVGRGSAGPIAQELRARLRALYDAS